MNRLAKRLIKIAEEVAKHPKFDTVEGIPDWATSYILYNDASGLSSAERRMVDKYIKDMAKAGYVFVEPIDGTETDFNPYPEFGKACGTVDWTVEVVEPDPNYGNDDGEEEEFPYADDYTVEEWWYHDFPDKSIGMNERANLRMYIGDVFKSLGVTSKTLMNEFGEDKAEWLEKYALDYVRGRQVPNPPFEQVDYDYDWGAV